jgi:soluble lytic murein transglycosylase
MKRLLILILIIIPVGGVGLYFFNQYWIHRYDALIAQQAAIYHLDPDLVWSVIYEETYFRPWKIGNDGEIGLMQVTPAVGREWAAEVKNSMPEFERQMQQNPESVLRDPQRNIQVGCWYLEKFYEQYRDLPGAEARMVAGYNAGKSRVDSWNQTDQGAPPLTADQFIQRIDIPSTRAYVSSILARYHRLKAERARNGLTQSNTQTSSKPEAAR